MPLGYQARVFAEYSSEDAGEADGTLKQSHGGEAVRVFFKGVNKVRTAKDENWSPGLVALRATGLKGPERGKGREQLAEPREVSWTERPP